MSALDYSRSTGRGFGQSGSLRTDTMSAMQRRDAVTSEVNSQKKESAFERRLMRQLGRASRRGDIDAGFDGLALTRQAQKEGRDVQGGISSYENNRSSAAQSLFDRNDLTNQQDAATDGTPNPSVPRTSIRPSEGPMPPGMRILLDQRPDLKGGVDALFTKPGPYYEEQAYATAEEADADDYKRLPVKEMRTTASAPRPTGAASAATTETPPSPTSEPSGRQVSALDRELLQYGARVNADMRKAPGFGSRPGYGLVSSRKEGTAPIGGTVPNDQGGMTLTNMPPGQSGSSRLASVATTAQSSAPSAAPPTYVPAMAAASSPAPRSRLDEAPPSPSAATPSRLDTPPSSTSSVSPEVQAKRAAEDAEYETRRASMAKQRQRDLDEGAGRNAELKASRVTENWQGSRLDSPIGFNMGSTSEMARSPRGRMIEKTTDKTSTLTYAEKDKDGNQYRPKGWTQEDEDASARASETGSRLERVMRYTPFGDRILGPQVAKQIGRIGKMKSNAAPPQPAKTKKRRT